MLLPTLPRAIFIEISRIRTSIMLSNNHFTPQLVPTSKLSPQSLLCLMGASTWINTRKLYRKKIRKLKRRRMKLKWRNMLTEIKFEDRKERKFQLKIGPKKAGSWTSIMTMLIPCRRIKMINMKRMPKMLIVTIDSFSRLRARTELGAWSSGCLPTSLLCSLRSQGNL